MKKSLLFYFAAMLFWGCGSGPVVDSSLTQASQSATASSIAGRVVSETGAPQEGVEVIVQERYSSFQATTRSAADGSFRLEVLPGTYDLSLDRVGDAASANCYYGPVLVGSQRDFVLKSTSGRSSEKVFGRIWLQPGTPANQRQLILRPGFWRGGTQEHQPVTLRTNSDGTFEASLTSSKEAGLDLEIYDGNTQLDEFIDLAKFNKACYVEVVSEQSPTVNRLRANQADPPGPSLGSSNFLFLKPVLFNVAYDNNSPLILPDEAVALITGGLIQPDGDNYNLKDLLVGLPPQPDPNSFPPASRNSSVVAFQQLESMMKDTQIRVESKGWWFWKYSVNINPKIESDWLFADLTFDNYSLIIRVTDSWHKVSYNSTQPAIQGIKISEQKQF